MSLIRDCATRKLSVAGFHRVICFLLLWLFVSDIYAQPNLARGAAVEASGPVWSGFVAASLTDGDAGTFAHPLAGSDTLGYYFEIDLGGTYKLDRIVLRNRPDGCCPERLSNYRVELYADAGGESGKLNWGALIRGDGSNSGVAGVDTVFATNNAEGIFAGRFVRIVNVSNAPYNPQIAEVEVYGGLAPRIGIFMARPDAIRSGEATVLTWEISGATAATLNGAAVNATGGEMLVRPNSTSTYTLIATNEAGSSSASVTIGVDVKMDPPQISEFAADNEGKLKDEDGESSDWIELSNPNAFSLALTGYYLTDNPEQPAKWQFPAVRIPANGFLVVFASGKDRCDSTAELHTNFRLDANGDYLALVSASRELLQQFPAAFPNPRQFPAQPKNVSYGVGSNGVTGFFRPSTPGAPNGRAFVGVVADTKLSRDRGFYDTNLLVTISCATPDATIRYSLNRSDVTANSGQVYSGPIAVTNTTVLRVAAFKEGWAPSDIDTHTYIFLSNVIASSVMRTSITRHPTYSTQIRDGLRDIPSISVVTPRTINGSSEVAASFEWLPNTGSSENRAIQEDCGVRNFGGAFTTFAKKSFRLYFRSEYGAAKLNYPLFHGFDRDWKAAEEFDQLELRSGSHDMVERGFYMSNVFTDDTLLEMGQLNPHGRFAHLYLNGVYWGLYHLRERWGASMHQSYLGGARTNYESINGNWNVGGWAEPGTPYDGDGTTWTTIKGLRSNYTAVKSLVDVPQYVDYMLMWLFGGAEDEYRCVGPNVSGSGFKFYLNDADGYFCGSWYCAAGNRVGRGAPGRSGGDGPGSLFSMLFKEGHPDYRVLLADRIYRAVLRDGALTPSRNADRLRRRCAEIERAFISEAARWNYISPAEWASRRNQTLSSWFPSRTAQFLSELRGTGFYPAVDAPVLVPPAGILAADSEVKFSAPLRGTIFYTLDGSDPRLPGGDVSASAKSVFFGATGESAVPAGSMWRWFTDGNGLGSSEIVNGDTNWSASNWKHPDFDDSAWKEGRAQLGYGEGDEVTVIPFGPSANQKWTSSYFRSRFNLANTQDISGLEVRLKRDDGAIVYLNGKEIIRAEIPAGVVTASTAAQSAVDDGQNFSSFTVDPLGLTRGTNVIAVELHQANPTTSDASFDLELLIIRSAQATASNAVLRIRENTVVKSRVRDGSTWSALNESFFQVGGAVSPGEIVVSELKPDYGRSGSEFVELSNASERAINLRGLGFVEGLSYAFSTNRDTLLAPNQKLVLVKDVFQFQHAYGLDVPIAGIYSGNLARQGEELTIGRGSNSVTTVSYHVLPPWPVLATRSNFSLVFAYPHLEQNDPAAWRLSVGEGGTPGSSDSIPFSGPPREDADNDGLPAVLEYALGTDDRNAVSGPGEIIAALDEAGNLILSFPRRPGTDDVFLHCESSEDLVTWVQATLLAREESGNGLMHETWGAGTAERRAVFLRLILQQLQ